MDGWMRYLFFFLLFSSWIPNALLIDGLHISCIRRAISFVLFDYSMEGAWCGGEEYVLSDFHPDFASV